MEKFVFPAPDTLTIKISDFWELGVTARIEGCILGGTPGLNDPPLPLEPDGDFAVGTMMSMVCPGALLAAMAIRSFTASTLPSAKSKLPL